MGGRWCVKHQLKRFLKPLLTSKVRRHGLDFVLHSAPPPHPSLPCPSPRSPSSLLHLPLSRAPAPGAPGLASSIFKCQGQSLAEKLSGPSLPLLPSPSSPPPTAPGRAGVPGPRTAERTPRRSRGPRSLAGTGPLPRLGTSEGSVTSGAQLLAHVGLGGGRINVHSINPAPHSRRRQCPTCLCECE